MDLTQIKEKLQKLCNLSEGWYDSGSLPVRQDIADSIIELVSQNTPYSSPNAIVPGFEGNCQLEYGTKDYYLELEVIEPYKAEIFIASEKEDEDDFFIHGTITWRTK